MSAVAEPETDAPEDQASDVDPRDTLTLVRTSSRLLKIKEDDGSVREYTVRANLDVETMATFLEAEEALTSGKHPVTGQPLTARQKANYYKDAHARVIEVIRERNPNANVSFDPQELLAAMAMLCGNMSVAHEIAAGLSAGGATIVADDAEGDEDGSTTGAAPGTGRPLASAQP